MEDRSYKLIIDYFEKTITDDGLTQLQDWIEESPENLAQFSETIQILEASKAYFNTPDHFNVNWDKLNAYITAGHTQTKSMWGVSMKWLAAAATIILVSALAFLWFKHTPNYVEVASANGHRTKVLLPDGSAVYLAGGSSIKYLKNFAGNTRNVALNGEAYFDVVHLADKSFTVSCSNITTVVLGTTFNVKAYTADSKVAVTVQSGKVGVMASVNGQNKLVKHLHPNEQIEIDTQTGLYNLNTVNAASVSGWVNNQLNFYNTSLRSIAQSVERQYGVRIQFTDAEMASIKLTAKFSNSTLPEVMQTLSALSGLACTQTGNHFFFTNSDQKGGSIMK